MLHCRRPPVWLGHNKEAMEGIKLTLMLLGCLFFAYAAEGNDVCVPIPGNDPCKYKEGKGEDSIDASTDKDTDEVTCNKIDGCCWDGSACRNKQLGSGEKVKGGKANPFSLPKPKQVERKLKGSQRNLGIVGPCAPPLPFPHTCKIQKNEPYVLSPPTDVPYCVRIPCSLDYAVQAKLDRSHRKCGEQPGCYFDVPLYEYREAFGPAVLSGVPVCHFAIRSAVFQREAREVVHRLGSWNPYFTNCLLKKIDDELNELPAGCKLIPLLRAFKISPKLAGWEGITTYECKLIDGCPTPYGCNYPVDVNHLVVKSGQRFKFNKHEITFGRPKCQHFNDENPYEILKSYHTCLSSGCTVDLGIVAKYYHYLFDIGDQMSVTDHWEYWANVLLGKITPNNLEGIYWKFDRSFKGKPEDPSTGGGGGDPPPTDPGHPFGIPDLGRRKRSIPGFGPGGGPPIPPVPTLPSGFGQQPKQCGIPYRFFGGRPCRPPVVPSFINNPYCPYKPFFVPRFKPLEGSFRGCCEVNYCYLSRRDIRKMHSGPATYYTEWSAFSDCSVSCGGGGTQKRVRYCTTHDEKECTEETEQSRSCGHQNCPTWARWSGWSPCPGRCMQVTRNRVCKWETASAKCKGKSQEAKTCRC